MKQVISIFNNELKTEFRNPQNFAGLVMYVFSTIFICYLSFKNILPPALWNALFWIVQVFAMINTSAKSFLKNSRGFNIYVFSLVHPIHYLFGKALYNAFISLFISFVSYLFFSFFIHNPVQDQLYFMLSLMLGCIAFSTLLNLVSAIASKTNSGFGLMAVLSFPMLVPLLTVIIKLSKNATDGLERSLSNSWILLIVLLIVVINTLGYILFPYLWKE